MTQPQTPPWQAALEKSTPDLFEKVSVVRGSILRDGALSLKVKTLMIMACDALLSHPGGVAELSDRARGLGASEEEIAESVGVAYLMGGMPALITGSNAFRT